MVHCVLPSFCDEPLTFILLLHCLLQIPTIYWRFCYFNTTIVVVLFCFDLFVSNFSFSKKTLLSSYWLKLPFSFPFDNADTWIPLCCYRFECCYCFFWFFSSTSFHHLSSTQQPYPDFKVWRSVLPFLCFNDWHLLKGNNIWCVGIEQESPFKHETTDT